MNDEMTLFFIIIGVVLVIVYRRSKRGLYGSEIPLTPGDWRVGEDIDPGKGDLVAVSGTGDINIMERGNGVWTNGFKLGADNPAVPGKYRNLTLHASDILQINGDIKVLITPPTPIADGNGAELTLGTYQFGVDIPPAKYDLTATEGDGQFTFFAPDESEFSVYQDMNPSMTGKASVYNNLLCEDGARIVVTGSLKLKLTKSKKQRGRFNKLLDFINQDP